VIILVIILFIVIEVVSSLTAPPAKAPVIPPSPARPIIPTPRVTPHATPHSTPRATPQSTPRTAPHATAKPTAKSTAAPGRDVALGNATLAEFRSARTSGARWIARFSGPGDAYQGKALVISFGPEGTERVIGRADPYVRPVWSPDQRSLLFVRARQVRQAPGASWSLDLFNRTTGTTREIAAERSMGVWPLGWRGGAVLFAVSNGSDTSLYERAQGKTRFLSILVPQVVSAPSLSPDARNVVFLTPADCSFCALSIFDLDALTTWFGPAGAPSEYDVAWTADGRDVAAVLSGKLALIDVSSHHTSLYALPAGLPAIWQHPMSARIVVGGLELVDQVTGRVYRAGPATA
jgi:hypothetical protein